MSLRSLLRSWNESELSLQFLGSTNINKFMANFIKRPRVKDSDTDKYPVGCAICVKMLKVQDTQ